MSQYSVAGYLIAVSQRTNHTVLVEGISDQKALKYCLLKSCKARGISLNKIGIDSVDIVKGEGTSFGAKDKIRLIHTTSISMNIDSKVTFFVDREFEDFDLAHPEVDSFPAHKIKPPNMYLSRGHSVENYFFKPDFVIKYLEFMYPSDLDGQHAVQINKSWDEILCTSAALSFSIFRNQLLGRCENAFRKEIWDSGSSGSLTINSHIFELSLLARGIGNSEISKIWQEFLRLKPLFATKTALCRWITHGHVGHNLLWAGIAQILFKLGVRPADCDELISNSFTKQKHLVESWYSSCSTENSEYPSELFERVYQKSVT